MRRGHESGHKIKASCRPSPSSLLATDKLDTPLEPNPMRDRRVPPWAAACAIVREGTSIVDELVRVTEFFAAESAVNAPLAGWNQQSAC